MMKMTLEQAINQAQTLLDDPHSGIMRVERCDWCEAPTFAVQGESSDGVNAYGYCLACEHTLTRTEVEVGALSRSLLSSVKP